MIPQIGSLIRKAIIPTAKTEKLAPICPQQKYDPYLILSLRRCVMAATLYEVIAADLKVSYSPFVITMKIKRLLDQAKVPAAFPSWEV